MKLNRVSGQQQRAVHIRDDELRLLHPDSSIGELQRAIDVRITHRAEDVCDKEGVAIGHRVGDEGRGGPEVEIGRDRQVSHGGPPKVDVSTEGEVVIFVSQVDANVQCAFAQLETSLLALAQRNGRGCQFKAAEAQDGASVFQRETIGLDLEPGGSVGLKVAQCLWIEKRFEGAGCDLIERQCDAALRAVLRGAGQEGRQLGVQQYRRKLAFTAHAGSLPGRSELVQGDPLCVVARVEIEGLHGWEACDCHGAISDVDLSGHLGLEERPGHDHIGLNGAVQRHGSWRAGRGKPSRDRLHVREIAGQGCGQSTSRTGAPDHLPV